MVKELPTSFSGFGLLHRLDVLTTEMIVKKMSIWKPIIYIVPRFSLACHKKVTEFKQMVIVKPMICCPENLIFTPIHHCFLNLRIAPDDIIGWQVDSSVPLEASKPWRCVATGFLMKKYDIIIINKLLEKVFQQSICHFCTILISISIN